MNNATPKNNHDTPALENLSGCGEIGMLVREETAARTPITGMTQAELKTHLESLGMKSFRAKQVYGFLYTRGVRDFADMHNIDKQSKVLLSEHCDIARPDIIEDHLSEDGTRKWLMRFADGQEVETVLIPEGDRGTLCISSQVGCTLACTFCHTGTQRLVRNLRAHEIIGQVLAAKDAMEGEWPTRPDARALTNIVFMGMGEPLMNADHVFKVCEILIDPDGLAFSRRKVTISTSGVVPKIREMSKRLGVNLALSLHAVDDELRDEIVPINKKYPLKELMASCDDYIAQHPSRRIFVEYVMLNGVNDRDEDAHNMIALLKNLPVKINLIPFNPWPNSPYTCSSGNRIHRFQKIVQDAGLAAPIRTTRGDDILAACGQLKSESALKKGQKVALK